MTPAVAFLLAAAMCVPAAAQERSSSDLERDLDAVRNEASQLESELGSVRSQVSGAEVELAQIGARLEDARGRLRSAEGQVALAEIALDDAQVRQDGAVRDHERSERLLAATERLLAEEEALLVDQIVQTFKYGTVGATRGAMALEVLRRAEDPNAFAVGMKQLRAVVSDQDATVTAVFDLREERSSRSDAAARARSRAVQAAAEAATTLKVVEELRTEAAALATEVAAEEDHQRRVLATLKTTEAETASLLQRVSARQATLTRDLQQQRAREEAARRAAEDAAAKAAAARGATSGGGGGRLSLPGAGGGPAIAGMVCPVVGAVAGRDYSNDWGYPRSGGRYHQGNDIFASRGTAVVAVHDGEVIRWNPSGAPTALGGITVTYRTADGSEWYNAHLDTVAGGIAPGASVSRGQTIGTVGNTGNARTTPPHLHLGRRYAGTWVNPWQATSPVCR